MSKSALPDRNELEALVGDLVYFARVAEGGGFSGAAMARGVPASTVSRAVSRLEAALGAKLFSRSTRLLSLTPTGQQLRDRCANPLRECIDAMLAIQGEEALPQGTLKVSAAAAFGRMHVAPLLGKFQRRHPEIAVELRLEDTLLDPARDALDLCIRGGVPPDSRHVARRIAPLPLYVCASRSYLEARGVPGTPEAIAGHSCIRFRFQGTGRLLRWSFQRDGIATELEPAGTLLLDDIESACGAAKEGHGLAQLPGYIAVPAIKAGHLLPVLLDWLDESRSFFFLSADRAERLPMRAQLFIEYLCAAVSTEASFALSEEELVQLRERVERLPMPPR